MPSRTSQVRLRPTTAIPPARASTRPAFSLQVINDAQALFVVPEAPRAYFAQGLLPGMPEGGVAEVVPQGDRFGQGPR